VTKGEEDLAMKRIVLTAALLLAASPAWAWQECLKIKEPLVAYARCVITWENKNLRASYPFPDLLDRLHRTRLDAAARYDRGEITKTEVNAELKRVQGEVYLEGKRRIDRQYGVVSGTSRLLEARTS
jgi:hypothetical protein